MLLSRPKRQLWLSWRSADDEGGAGARSPFVDDVRDMLSPALPDGIEERDEALFEEAGGRGLADSVFEAARRPDRGGARALARGPPSARATRPTPGWLSASPASSRESPRIAFAPGPLRLDPVLELMKEKELFGASTLEQYAECPYRWFVERELEPEETTPLSDSLAAGSVAHLVLEKLYLEPPADERPRPWRRWTPGSRARAELITELGPEQLPRERAETAALLHRVEGLVVAFLLDEAEAGAAFQPKTDRGELRLRGSRAARLCSSREAASTG